MRRAGVRRVLEVRICKLYLRVGVDAAYVLRQPSDANKFCIYESLKTSESK